MRLWGNLSEDRIDLQWERVEGAGEYRVYWSDRYTPDMVYRCVAVTGETGFTLQKATHIPHYLKVEAWKDGKKTEESPVLKTPVKKRFREQLERLNRGLIAVSTEEGIFLSWRLFRQEVAGYCETGLTGVDFYVYRNGERIALVTDSTNFLDREGCQEDSYAVAPVRQAARKRGDTAAEFGEKRRDTAVEEFGEKRGATATEFEGKCGVQTAEKYEGKCGTSAAGGVEGEPCDPVTPWVSPDPSTGGCLEILLQKPEGGVTPAGEHYEYTINDMSVGDVDGDGEYELFVKWDPENSHDVSVRGYTGRCLIDCYRMSGRLLWRLDLGPNIRAGAHYTQFMVYDFDGDGRAEMSVKTAPGTYMTVFREDGSVESRRYITLPAEDVAAGVCHGDDYVCSAEDYAEHLVEMFQSWHTFEEVKRGQWPANPEVCLGREPRYSVPLSGEEARELTDYFLDVYAPSRSPANRLREFEGFIFRGPEYLTMFGGDGRELETIPFPHPRVDDGLRWGDYAMARIEPCNRVDRFLSGVAYLDGERPYLIVCRGYYTRTTVAAYAFREGRHRLQFDLDSGFVPMKNPFCDNPHEGKGTDPVYGILAGQGNHSLAAADVDGDGCQEIIYGAAVIDHDGSLLYSSYGKLPDGREAKLGHGDSMHVAVIDPDRAGYQIFNVFEGAEAAPYGWALRDAETGEVLFGEPADRDLGRCMVGDVCPEVRGLQVWTSRVYDCKGNFLSGEAPGTNASIRWAGDLSTQIIDGADYLKGEKHGVIQDRTRGVLLDPWGTAVNNGTKGNPCLIADLFGDFREELVLRREDNRAIRIYTCTELTKHKLFTLMHDVMYRTGIAWQNNCYNQPCYPRFYYGRDMDFSQAYLTLAAKTGQETAPSSRE